MATKTTPMSELALKGGAPFRVPDDPLPTSVPRPVAPEASRTRGQPVCQYGPRQQVCI